MSWADCLVLVGMAEQLASWEGEIKFNEISHGNYRLLGLDNFTSFHTQFWPYVAPFMRSVMGWVTGRAPCHTDMIEWK